MSHNSRSALLIVFLIIAQGSGAYANVTLAPATYLRKLSLQIRGIPPSIREQDELAAAVLKENESLYFDGKIKEYLASRNHVEKMTSRLEELFRLETAPAPDDQGEMRNGIAYPNYQNHNALNSLFSQIASENLSWDTLLTGKSYDLAPVTLRVEDHEKLVEAPRDFAFLKSLSPEHLPALSSDSTHPSADSKQPIHFNFQAGDSRIAGALTTARFFERYPTTAVNKNRKRAAAVYNIFLCDAMVPSIPTPGEDQHELLAKAFPPTSTLTDADFKNLETKADPHGASEDCRSCHYKLDPVGRVFLTSPVTLSPFAAPGSLVYTTREKKLIEVPVHGLGELGRAIVSQPDYSACQTQRFWDWFIGKDRALPMPRQLELMQKFEAVGRRTNDFIAYLVATPEFREIDTRTPAQLQVENVKSILQNCNGCHRDKLPSLSVWPIGGSPTEMKTWVQKISSQMDLEHDGNRRRMPPRSSTWQPSPEQLATLKTWIDVGAPAEDGKAQL